MRIEGEISRRRFLAMGGALAAAGTIGSLVDPLAASARRVAEGSAGRRATRSASTRPVHAGLAVPRLERGARQGRAGQPEGLRATGSAAHEHYVERPASTTSSAPASSTCTPSRSRCSAGRPTRGRWTWSTARRRGGQDGVLHPLLGADAGRGRDRAARLVEPAPTPAPGSLAGKIAVFDVPSRPCRSARFALCIHGPALRPGHELAAQYKRPVPEQRHPGAGGLAAAGAAGSSGCSTSRPTARDGSYFPYDGILRSVPGPLRRPDGRGDAARARAAGDTAR